MRGSPTLAIYVLGALWTMAPGAAAIAGDRGPLDQDLQFSLGGFFVTTDTEVRLDGEASGTGTEIDWESEFDLDDKDSFRLDAFWRFAERHKVRLMWFENERGATRTTTRDINFGDTTFPVTTEVSARLDTSIIEVAYEYAFLQREGLELSGSFGIHDVKFGASLRGDVSTPGGGGSAEVAEAAETHGPLPVLGFRALWDIGANFYFDGLAQYFYIEFDNYTGRLYDLKAGVTWYPTRHFGVGIAYNTFVTKIGVEQGNFDGALRLGYGGPMAFVTAGF